MASLAQLTLGRDQDGFPLLVVVSGMASETGEASLGVPLAQIDVVAGRAESLSGFWSRVCEATDFVWIPSLNMRRARPMAAFAALLRRLFFLQCLHMRRLGKALVLILGAALADFGASVVGRIALSGGIGCFLGQRWETNDCEQTSKTK